MSKTGGILILSLFAVISVVNAGDPKIVTPETVTEDDIKSLSRITIKDALPIILFQSKEDELLAPPEKLIQANLNDGRLLYGTEFEPTSLITSSTQHFFCPHPVQMNDHCLILKKFEQSESKILECERAPIPVIEEMPRESQRCGPATGGGIKLNFVYKVCPEQTNFENNSKNFATYSFCYDQSSKKILFMNHEIISANLLSERILVREREVEFETLSAETYNLIHPDYQANLDAAAAKFQRNYTFQKLVPAGDMAFATWIRTTYHYVNIALQHNALLHLWNEINIKIRAEVAKSGITDYASSTLNMITAILDTPTNELPIIEQEKQLSNVWVKVILNLNEEDGPYTGLAILMNNFITGDTSNSKRQFIDTSRICPKNLCVDTLTQKFADVGGEVRCCAVTEHLLRFFFKDEELVPIEKVMPILDVTYRRLPV